MTALPKKKPSVEERLFSNVHFKPGCWTWLGYKDGRGYGRFNLKGASSLAHRLVYEWYRGPIPDELALDHLCCNQSCVNPDHLEPVTSQENLRRYWATVTHCPHGHEFTPENTYLTPAGHRKCRCCHAAETAARRKASA